jgi:hypothetical protein
MHRKGTGVLNDFDLARLTTPGNVYPRGFDRTGTTPFLALDLLTKDAQDGKVERRYRHDLESFLWVLMWITACYDNGVESIPDTHYCWLDENISTCYNGKSSMLRDRTVITTSDSYESLTAVTMILLDYWKDFYHRQQEETRPSTYAYAWMRSKKASSSTPVVATEPSDEQVLFNMLHTFALDPTPDNMRDVDLILPSTLFSTYVNPSSLST